MAKDLKAATIDSAKYSREFLAKRRAAPMSPPDPSSKMPPRKVRGTGNVLPPERRKSARESLKYTYATWVRYFFGDYDACKYFLYECFPEYAPIRTVLKPLQEGENRPLEPRVWGWSIGRPRQLLSELLDEQDQFVHRPYTLNFFSGVEAMQFLYRQSAFPTRNNKASRSEGAFDLWQLILQPQFLPGFIITDTVSSTGGAFWPYSYRLDRVCRQFGLDQPPRCIKLDFCDISEAMKVVLFNPVSELPAFDPSKFIPPDRVGRVLDVLVSYYARLKTSVKRYEGQVSMQVFMDIQVMHKDPYFVTTTSKSFKKADDKPPVKKAVQRRKTPQPSPSLTPTPSKKPLQARSPKVKKKLMAPSWASERVKALTLKNVLPPNSPSRPIVISDVNCGKQVCNQVVKDSPPPSTVTQATTQSSLANKVVNEENANPASSDYDSIPGQDNHEGEVPASEPSSVQKEPPANLAPPSPVPDVFPPAFMRPAYNLFAEFSRFVRSHSFVELLSSYKAKITKDLKALSLFGFKGDWFDSLFCCFDQQVPSSALEDLEEISKAILTQEQSNDEMRAEIDRMKTELAVGEAKLEQLIARREAVMEARAKLVVPI
ncbi:hypothetical protein SESBI_03618 [Sesbania bispinosa]|nr:hypothetical protein SESBI_03618 [Sesbania bispinosa]